MGHNIEALTYFAVVEKRTRARAATLGDTVHFDEVKQDAPMPTKGVFGDMLTPKFLALYLLIILH